MHGSLARKRSRQAMIRKRISTSRRSLLQENLADQQIRHEKLLRIFGVQRYMISTVCPIFSALVLHSANIMTDCTLQKITFLLRLLISTQARYLNRAKSENWCLPHFANTLVRLSASKQVISDVLIPKNANADVLMAGYIFSAEKTICLLSQQ